MWSPAHASYGDSVEGETLKEGKDNWTIQNTFGEICPFSYIFPRKEENAAFSPTPFGKGLISQRGNKPAGLHGSSEPGWPGFKKKTSPTGGEQAPAPSMPGGSVGVQPWFLGSKANICRRRVSEEVASDHSAVPLSTTDAEAYPSPPNVPPCRVTKVGEFTKVFIPPSLTLLIVEFLGAG